MKTTFRDYLEPTETQDNFETKFVDRVLEGWARWSHSDGIDLRPVAMGDLWPVQVIIEAREHVLELCDDEWLDVDSAVATLPKRLKSVVFVEYRYEGSSGEKARLVGLTRLAYRQRLHAAQWALFTKLQPHLDAWRQRGI